MPGLLATKLHRPSTPIKRIQRPRLIERLNDGLSAGRQITLVSAPPGFGKTTCVSDWVSDLELPVAWLSLDAADDDPERFFTYFLAVLQKVDPDLGREVESVVRAGQIPPGEVISTSLLNDIENFGKPFVLVLDDFQVLQDRTILQVMDKLVTNITGGLHLVILSREDPALPLARLRANNRLTEVRAQELRFTEQEASLFFNDMLGLCLSPADIAQLEERTEGWVVGLQLAGLSVRDRPDPSKFITSLKGSHRYILSYLTEEVLNRQPEDVRQFLLQTSILDRLSGDLCNAVTGRTDSRILLERLCNANLFLIPLDDDQQWYRYHHLFADLLQDLHNDLQKDQSAGLHQRASRWYQEAGMVNEAVSHALAAADYQAVVRLIENHTVELLIQGYSKTVEGWLNAIPSELRAQSLKTNMAFVWMHLLQGTYEQAFPFVARLQEMFSSPGIGVIDTSTQAEWLTIQSYLLVGQGKIAESLDLANQALKIVPDEEGYVRSLAYNALASAYTGSNDYPRAVEACQKAIQFGRVTSNFYSELMGFSVLVQISLQHGRYHFAYETALEGVSRVESVGSKSPISTAVYGALGQVYYQWNQFDKAREFFRRSVKMIALTGFLDLEVYHRVIFSRLLQMEGDLNGASQEIQKAVDRLQVIAPAWLQPEVVSQLVRIDLAQGHLNEAIRAFSLLTKYPVSGIASGENASLSMGKTAELPAFEPGQRLTYSDGLIQNSALRILLYQCRTKPDPERLQRGIERANLLIAESLRGQYLSNALEALLLRAQLNFVFGDDKAGLEDVATTLELAEPEGYISAFVEEGISIADALSRLLQSKRLGPVQQEYVQKILTAFPGEQAAPKAPPQPSLLEEEAETDLIEPLSRRESDVLNLIGRGSSNQEIAAQLVLSLHTVKKHISNIFSKLGVTSRTQAVARARELGLLEK